MTFLEKQDGVELETKFLSKTKFEFKICR